MSRIANPAFGYGAVALCFALFGITYYVYLPKLYADNFGIDLTALGMIILFSRIFDAVSDPVVGLLSDRTKSTLGRRRPWIIVGAPLLALSFIFLTAPDIWRSTISIEGGFALLTLIFFLGWTCVVVPYEAWGVEISQNYDQRTNIFGWRDGFLVFGTLAASVFPILIPALGGRLFNSELGPVQSIQIVGGIYVLIFGALLVLLLVSTRERREYLSKAPTELSLAALKSTFHNRAFRVLLVTFVVGGVGGAIPATLIPFYVEHVLGSKDWGYFLVLYFLVGLAALPFWIRFASRWDKKWVWIVAMAVNSIAFSCVYFLGSGDIMLYGLLVAISGVGYGATLALPSSMQADIVDIDELNTGKRREGQFLGIMSVSKKLAWALGAGAVFPVLEWAGYQNGMPVQSAKVQWWLGFLYAGVPSICNLIAIAIAFSYPVTRESYQRISEQLGRVQSK